MCTQADLLKYHEENAAMRKQLGELHINIFWLKCFQILYSCSYLLVALFVLLSTILTTKHHHFLLNNSIIIIIIIKRITTTTSKIIIVHKPKYLQVGYQLLRWVHMDNRTIFDIRSAWGVTCDE